MAAPLGGKTAYSVCGALLLHASAPSTNVGEVTSKVADSAWRSPFSLIATTASIYVHVFDDVKRENARKLEAYVGGIFGQAVTNP